MNEFSAPRADVPTPSQGQGPRPIVSTVMCIAVGLLGVAWNGMNGAALAFVGLQALSGGLGHREGLQAMGEPLPYVILPLMVVFLAAKLALGSGLLVLGVASLAGRQWAMSRMGSLLLLGVAVALAGGVFDTLTTVANGLWMVQATPEYQWTDVSSPLTLMMATLFGFGVLQLGWGVAKAVLYTVTRRGWARYLAAASECPTHPGS